MPVWLINILRKLFVKPVIDFIGNAILKLIKRWVRKSKDSKDIENAKKEGEQKLEKINDAKNNKDKSSYIDNITDI